VKEAVLVFLVAACFTTDTELSAVSCLAARPRSWSTAALPCLPLWPRWALSCPVARAC
jgi:hypothetical protein